MEELEPRLLLSADLSLGMAVPEEPALEGSVLEARTVSTESGSAVSVDRAVSEPNLTIVLVDSTLPDSDLLSSAAKDGAVVIEYDGANESMVDVLARVEALAENRDAQIGSVTRPVQDGPTNSRVRPTRRSKGGLRPLGA